VPHVPPQPLGPHCRPSHRGTQPASPPLVSGSQEQAANPVPEALHACIPERPPEHAQARVSPGTQPEPGLAGPQAASDTIASSPHTTTRDMTILLAPAPGGAGSSPCRVANTEDAGHARGLLGRGTHERGAGQEPRAMRGRPSCSVGVSPAETPQALVI
jgi:hypothetical protein